VGEAPGAKSAKRLARPRKVENGAMDYCISSVRGRRSDFQKVDRQGKKPFAKGAPRTASNAFVQALS
jgi:hypothetical protein